MLFWDTGITRSNTNKMWLVAAIMLSALLLPAMEIRESLPKVRLDEVLIFGVFAVNGFHWLLRRLRSSVDYYNMDLVSREGKKRALRAVNFVFFFLVVSIAVSNVYAVIFLDINFGVGDVLEWVMLAKYYLVITLALSLDLQVGEFDVLRNVFFLGFVIIIILAGMQFLNLFNVNEWLTPFFAQAPWPNQMEANSPGVVGTFDNPETLGIVSTMMMTLFVTWFYFRRHDRLQAFLLMAAIILTIILTGMTISRPTLLATASVLTFMSIWAMFKFQWRKEIILKIGVLFVVVLALIISFMYPRDFAAQTNEADDLNKSTSAQGHLMGGEDSVYELIRQSPVLGWGTATYHMTTHVDNEYALVTRRYGLIGLAAYLWFFLRPVKGAWQRGRMSFFSGMEFGMQETKPLLCLAFTGVILAVLIYNMKAGTFYNLQLMTLVGLFMGFIYRIEGEGF